VSYATDMHVVGSLVAVFCEMRYLIEQFCLWWSSCCYDGSAFFEFRFCFFRRYILSYNYYSFI